MAATNWADKDWTAGDDPEPRTIGLAASWCATAGTTFDAWPDEDES